MSVRRCRLALLLLPLQLAAAAAQEEDFPPGLFARYTAGEEFVERVDPAVAFVWGADSPDQRLPRGSFDAEWTSFLLLRQEGTYRFHAHVQGEVTVEVDGATVLAGRRDAPGWISGEEARLGFGEKPLKVTFRKTADAARVRLFWSSDSFDLEPIPTYLLFREEPAPELALVERGRQLFESHRCNRCHRRESDPPEPPAPALTRLDGQTNPEWLLKHVRDPRSTTPDARMPVFGYGEAEARAIVGWLLRNGEPTNPEPLPKAKQPDEERRKGEVLFRSLGCLACHRVGDLGTTDGGDLSNVGAKRTADWLSTWLKAPDALNVDHRMPVFRLSDAERGELALYLSGLGGETDDAAGRSWVSEAERLHAGAAGADGATLIRTARCAACHRIPGIEASAENPPDLSAGIGDWTDSCLAETPDSKTGRPVFPGIDREAVIAYANSRRGALSPQSRFERGELILRQRNCLACHERDGAKGIVPIAGSVARVDANLRGESEALIPPALTAVGDKLHDAALAEAVSGEQKTVRLPWLRVRMPRFDHAAEDKGALLDHLTGRDRIPDGGPQATGVATAPANGPQALVAGHALVGVTGFSCIACHKIGSYEPRNVVLGTRGSDLFMLGERMRPEYYLRWTASPQRIVPGMEMPSYRKAVPGVLGEDVRAQLLATWSALNDPKFTPPTNPASVEQFLTVAPGDPPRIVRDVFSLPKSEGGGYVARPLAIGLNNGHNVLFDLNTCSIRQWTFGDFARQRTEGKSWYWDMAGVPMMTGFSPEPGFVLREIATGRLHDPIADGGRIMRLGSWSTFYVGDRSDVAFEYDLRFETAGGEPTLRVREMVGAYRSLSGETTGWSRDIAAAPHLFEGDERRSLASDGYELLVARPEASGGGNRPSVEHLGTLPRNWEKLPGRPGREFLTLEEKFAEDGTSYGVSRTILRYASDARLERVESPAAPAVASPRAESITSVPGYDGVRLPVDRGIMPTAITWTEDGTLSFTSLKGHVYLARDTDGDALEDSLSVFEEGLAAPYGILADGDDLIVSHKPELVRLKDEDGNGRADTRHVIASGWGYSDNYHDWTCGIVWDAAGNFYVGLGSDYAQPERKKGTSLWRGKILRISPAGEITPVAHAFRYPTGLAMNKDGELFATDNQGVQNTFNEVNHIVEGRHYGVPARFEEQPDAKATPPAIQIPHPWTRSVNGIAFLPANSGSPFAGQGIGCEYDTRFLVRFSLQKVGGEYQGAVYPFSRPDAGTGGENFTGPLSVAVAPSGDIYIGSIHDSGWLGGRNTGDIVRLRRTGELPNGIRELRATADGFEIDFIDAVDPRAAADAANFTISGYTRVWEGAYATPDSGRYKVQIDWVALSADGMRVKLECDDLRAGYVYEVTCGKVGEDREAELWPATGHYTMRKVPVPAALDAGDR